MKGVVGVDPNSSSLDGVCDLEGGVEVAGVDSGSKAVGGVVAELDNLLLGLELGDGADGAENLFLDNLHVVGDVGEDSGLDEETLGTNTVATSLDGGALLLAVLNVPVKLSVYELNDCERIHTP